MFICSLRDQGKVVSKTFGLVFCGIDSFCLGVIFIVTVGSFNRVSLIGTNNLLRFEAYLHWQVCKEMSSSSLLQ